MSEVAPGRTTVVVTRDPWPLDGVVPQLWGRSHVAVGPDGRVHRAPGFWRLWFKLHATYPGRVRVPVRVIEQDAPQPRGQVSAPQIRIKREGTGNVHR